MGTSFIDYQDHGFWVRDGWIEDWLALLVRQFDQAKSLSHAQQAARDHFELQSKGYFNGFVHPCLDEHVTDETKDWIVSESQSAFASVDTANTHLAHCAQNWISLITGDFQVHETAYFGDIHRADAICHDKPDLGSPK